MVETGLRPGQAAHFGPFLYLLALQLGKHGEKSYHSFAKGRGRVEALLHRDEVYVVRKEDFFDEIERVPLRAGEAIQFVDQHQVEFARFLDKLLYAGAIEIASRVAPVNIDVGYYPVLCFAVCNQAFFLFADRITLLRLFLSRDADIEGCSVAPCAGAGIETS